MADMKNNHLAESGWMRPLPVFKNLASIPDSSDDFITERKRKIESGGGEVDSKERMKERERIGNFYMCHLSKNKFPASYS